MKNFSLTLYAFHLRHTLAHTPDQVLENAFILWDNLSKLGVSSFPATGLKDLKSQLICYKNGEYEPQQEVGRKNEWLTHSRDLDLGSFPTTDGFKINGNLQPFLLNDTYAVDLTLIPESANIDINVPQIQHFKPSCFLPSQIQASLGQTLWIYGEVEANENCQDLANKLANALVANTNLNPVFIHSGKLFDSELLIYQANEPNEPNNPVKQCQILILLNNQQSNTVQLIVDAYEWLLNLLCCYHKILFLNYQASQSYSNARTIYSYLENKIQEFQTLISKPKTQISDLKKLLSEIPQKGFDYTRCLQDLQTHNTAIQTNIRNYQICLNKITIINNQISPQFWQDFVDKDCQKWQEQIQTDINYLTPGQELFGQFIDTIRGIVETEQTESDRSLEKTIQILGIGFGGGGIVSGVVTSNIEKINRPIAFISPHNPPHPFYASLFLSIIATCLFIIVGWLITKRK
ncbi:hypothetical protein H6G54_24305 [Anabaena cylindrica FACHB-243]|uniref:Uncharacterized protein n=1 Tax=Anabaena cylindrica (strain ATCC 27899 / PCC 7122) TaxID=272123 RepID=K9ZFJ2_ANACC|nr:MULTISPECIES: hypothetical protein [Anabaena]AFZ57988.1 hypothetical protein Anacy_2544 [Anabaena cylindrica PCC 7122]MBD2420766.1 hypothetical protein [Anabaena cylindrica FACHB-243]MCM2408214.1 hypothetical protein [Anabaena sp. CCAP 1446/1C]BAY05048.1 hypothetical protein NIES19_43170 [Anabaena cylindrica PCC 7122]